MSSMLSVADADTHLSRAFGPGCAWRRGGDVPRLPDRGGEVGDRDDLGHLLDPGTRAVFLPRVPAVLRAHRDALAVALHHEHVAGRPVSVRVPGAPGVEVVRPGGEVLGEPGQLGAADRDAGAGLDDLLGLPEPAAGQVEGRQGPHAQGVRVAGQDLPGTGRVQVRLAPVPAGHPGDPDRPEHAGHAPPVPGLDDAVPDPGRADDRPGRALLAGGIDVERGLQHQPLQLAALFPDHLLPLPVIAEPGLARRPGRQPGELLRRGGQRRRQLPLQRSLAPVVADLPHRHREPHRHRRASGFLPGMISRHPPGNAPGTRATCDGTSSRPCPELTITTTPDQCESLSVMPGMPCNTPDSPDTKLFNPKLVDIHTYLKDAPLYSGKHKTTGMNLQVACTIYGKLAWISDPVNGSSCFALFGLGKAPSAASFGARVEDEGVIDAFFGGAGLGSERGRQLGLAVPVAAGQVDPDGPAVS